MKRFIPLFLLAVFLVSFAVPLLPVSAAETYTISGEWTFNETVTLIEEGSATFPLRFKSQNMDWDSITVYTDHISVQNAFIEINMYTVTSGWNGTFRTVTFYEQEVPELVYLWIVNNAIPKKEECTGNGHSVTDADFNDYCDICTFPIHPDYQIQKPEYCDLTHPSAHDLNQDNYCDTCGQPVRIVERTCDGSACAWADADYNGICDTCGYALMSFRYNLMDFARETMAEGQAYFTKAKYWLITEGFNANIDENYFIFIAEEPFVYANSQLTSNGNVYAIRVSFNASGVPVDDGWKTIAPNIPLTYQDPIDSGTDIEGFFPPPDPDIGGGEGGGNGSSDSGSEGDGFLDRIGNAISGIFDTLQTLSKGVLGNLGLFDGWKEFVEDMTRRVLSEIFVPDADYIEEAFTSFLEELKMKFNFDTEMFESLFDSETPVEDVYVDIDIPNVGNFNLKLLDTKFFVDGVTYFRPFIRGFLVLLLFFFHISQLIGFFGYNAGVVQGRSDWIDYNKSNTGGHKE